MSVGRSSALTFGQWEFAITCKTFHWLDRGQVLLPDQGHRFKGPANGAKSDRRLSSIPREELDVVTGSQVGSATPWH
jgi:hypothetical protein